MDFEAKIPDGPIEDKWTGHLESIRLVGPRNRPKYKIIVVGSGLSSDQLVPTAWGLAAACR